MSEQTIWMYGEVGSNYHDVSCKCGHHCQQCFENPLTGSYPNPRTRYCSTYCQNLAKQDRALSRALSAPKEN